MFSHFSNADDLCFITNNIQDIQPLIRLVKDFEKVSGLKLNPSKFKLVAFWNPYNHSQIDRIWFVHSFEHLGYRFNDLTKKKGERKRRKLVREKVLFWSFFLSFPYFLKVSMHRDFWGLLLWLVRSSLSLSLFSIQISHVLNRSITKTI